MGYSNRADQAEYMRNYRKKQRKDVDQGDVKKAGEKKVYVGMRLPESMAARIARMVHSGKFPWRTPAEMYRALVSHGMQMLKDHVDEEDWADLQPILEFRGRLDSLAQARTEAESFVTRFQSEIGALLKMGAEDSAAHVYNSAMDIAHKMTPSAYRDWMIATLRKRYGRLEKVRPRSVSFIDQKARSWKQHREMPKSTAAGPAAVPVKGKAGSRKKR